MSTSRALAAVAVPVVAATGFLVAAPASAAIADRGSFSDSYAYTTDACGTPVGATGTTTGRYLDQLRGSDPVPFELNQFTDTTTYTNLVTHRSFTTVLQGTHLDTGYLQVTGTVVEVSGKDSGTFSVYDSSGTLYRRQAGLQRATLTIDTMGTDDPSDDVVLSAQFSSYGHFPTGDFCADVQALTG